MERHILGFLTPVTWFNTLDGVMTIVGTALAVRFWAWRTKPGTNANDIRRIMVGFALATIGFLVLTGGAVIGGAGKAPLIFEVLFFICVDFAIPWIDTIIVTMISRDSPVALTSTLLGVYYIGVAGGELPDRRARRPVRSHEHSELLVDARDHRGLGARLSSSLRRRLEPPLATAACPRLNM